MSAKILIIGSTGKLGSKLLHSTNENNIKVFGATCFSNYSKLKKQKNIYNIKNIFKLSDKIDKKLFMSFLKNKIDIIYFLDFGSHSLLYLNQFLKFNSNSLIAIANKEMIIAGGNILITKISNTKNEFIPLDSEHFSLRNHNLSISNVRKILITASGGPLFFSKYKSFKKIMLSKVLSHPKWSMGVNNLIDSSNFINKILELYELSYIYNIPINKLDFIISRAAFIHSVVVYEDGVLSFNAFKNDMELVLVYPLKRFFNINKFISSESFISNSNNFKFYQKYDSRFKIFKYLKSLKNLNHQDQIKLLLLNNQAQSLYLSDKLNYNDIIPFIVRNIKRYPSTKPFKSLIDILTYIDKLKTLIKDA